MSLLEVKNLTTELYTSNGTIKAVDDVSFNLNKGEILGLVGESGCGKSMTSMSIMGLLDKKYSKVSGQVIFDGVNLLQLNRKEMDSYRGNKISMIFQDVMTSLNPLMKIGDQISETLICHKHMSKKEAKTETVELLKAVGIPAPEERFFEYPNSLSGGMRQRVMIAIALACKPDIIIADEPTTALDVTIQAQIIELMKKIRDEFGTSIIMISHDIGVISSMCDRAAVMYCGSIVEQGTIEQIFDNPKHPYTKGLMACVPNLDINESKLYNIPGMVPPLYSLPNGCRFADRCSMSHLKCKEKIPELVEQEPNHFVRCVGWADE